MYFQDTFFAYGFHVASDGYGVGLVPMDGSAMDSPEPVVDRFSIGVQWNGAST